MLVKFIIKKHDLIYRITLEHFNNIKLKYVSISKGNCKYSLCIYIWTRLLNFAKFEALKLSSSFSF